MNSSTLALVQKEAERRYPLTRNGWGEEKKIFLAGAEYMGSIGMKWVKCSDESFTPEYRKTYFAKWVDEKLTIRSTGRFQESDGTFFWREEGLVPVLAEEYDNLFILIEPLPSSPDIK